MKEGLNINDNKWTELTDDLYGKCFINISDRELNDAEKVLDSLNIDPDRPLICIQTTAGWRAKEWDEKTILHYWKTSDSRDIHTYLSVHTKTKKKSQDP
ncbi:MAG: hypothetical protein R3A12_12100 [Ignavibacteria bacterium]